LSAISLVHGSVSMGLVVVVVCVLRK
jgi:hypothetical protein